MGIFMQLALGGLVAYWISNATSIPFIWAAAGVLGVYLLWRFGLPGTVRTAGHGVGGFFGSLRSLIVAYAVFCGVIMIADRLTGVSAVFAATQLQTLGWRFWGWPAHVGLPVILWVCTAFLAAHVASKAAHGDWQKAGTIFAASALVIFGMMYLPTTTQNVVPVGATAWVELDNTLAKDGAVSVVATRATTLVAGKPSDLKENGVIGSTVRRGWRFLFGTTAERAVAKLQAASSSTASTSTVVYAAPAPRVVKIGQSKTLYRFGPDGCVTLPLRGGWSSYPKGGEIVFYSLETGQEVLRDKPGTVSGSSLPAGEYRICRYDPAAWGVEVWQ
jgi:hypothetical protein